MGSHGGQKTHGSSIYRIVVRAEIGERFAMAFEEMEVRPEGGRTIITGEVIDQSHLHGILARISSLGLHLVSVEPVTEEPQSDEASHPRMADELSSIDRKSSDSTRNVRGFGSTEHEDAHG